MMTFLRKDHIFMKRHSKETLSDYRKKASEKHKLRRKIKQKHRRYQPCRNVNLVGQLHKVIHHFFPNLFDNMRELKDCREKSAYELAEIITACLAIFIFKSGSRNEFNNQCGNGNFKKNYQRLFGLALPHPDTVDRVMRKLSEEQLVQLKQRMVQALLKSKTLHKFRFQKKWFVIAVDGTGVVSYSHKHCNQCLHKTSKKGKTTYFHNVLEAKLITPNGFAISIATEWIANPDGEYEKQDCERKAFQRLAAQLKKAYPRLPICITADALYPYQGFFDTCKANDWAWIITFKNGNLSTVWDEVNRLRPLTSNNHRTCYRRDGNQSIGQHYTWFNYMDYHGHRIHWIECTETTQALSQQSDPMQTRFVHLTNLEIDYTNAPSISQTGRLRWKIENEGFNTQKNQGYAMQHQYSRVNWLASKNYYQCLQMAHLINQLLILSTEFQQHLVAKMTIKHLWKRLIGVLTYTDIDEQALRDQAAVKGQIRFVT